MTTELEAKFLDINPDQLRGRLRATGAILIYPERFMRRNVFDYPDSRLEKIGGWIRVRDEGDVITLSYKRLFDRTLEGTKEVSVNVSDFEKTSELLFAIGLEKKSYQETKREKWGWNGVEITIDTWPWIPTFVELEAESEQQLKEMVQQLGLEWIRALHGSVETANQKYYDVTEGEIDHWKSITFIPVPDWLEARRKT